MVLSVGVTVEEPLELAQITVGEDGVDKPLDERLVRRGVAVLGDLRRAIDPTRPDAVTATNGAIASQCSAIRPSSTRQRSNATVGSGANPW